MLGHLQRPYAPVASLYAVATPRDRELFYTLRISALKSLTGVFDREFWSKDAVQAVQSIPALWHAGLAIAEEYRCRLASRTPLHFTDTDPRRAYAREHYGKAIQSLIAITSKTELSSIDKQTVLLCTVLLTGLCCLWHDYPAATTHLGQGIQVFRRWHIQDLARLYPAQAQVQLLKISSITLLFHRFEQQYASLGDADIELPFELPATIWELRRGSFTSATEAYSELLPILNAIQFAGKIISPNNPRPERPSRHQYRSPFYNWKARFSRLSTLRGMSDAETACILTLKIWSTTLEIHFLTTEGPRLLQLLEYDTLLSTFQHIIELAENLYDILARDTSLSPTLPLFSFSLSITEALLSLRLCRDGEIRRRAIALLRKWPRQDGFMPSAVTAMRLEQAMLWEEHYTFVDRAERDACCQCVAGTFICGWHRVVSERIESAGPTGTRKAYMWLITHLDAEENRYALGLVEKRLVSY